MNIEFTIKNKRRSTYLSIPQKAGVFSAEHKHVVGVEAGAAGRDLYGLGVEVVGASHLEQTHGGGFVGRPLSGAPFLSNTQPLGAQLMVRSIGVGTAVLLAVTGCD